MTTYGQDEQLVLIAFVLGMLAHAFICVHSPRRIGETILILAGSALVAWFLSEEQDRLFEATLMTAFLFPIAFAFIFREQVMPLSNTAGMLHLTFVLYYLLAVSLRSEDVVLPPSITVLLSVPALLAFALVIFGTRTETGLRKLAQAWFLILLTVLTMSQISIMADMGPRRGEASLVSSIAWFFLAGPLWMYFLSNLVYLVMLLPALSSTEARFRDSVTREPDVSVEPRRKAAQRFLFLSISPIRWLFLLFHTLVLATNFVFEYLPHGVMISASVVLLAEFDAVASKNHNQPMDTDSR